MKFFVFDLETTGLDERIHGITQIAGICLDTKLHKRHVFNFRIKPLPHQQVTDEALTITNLTREEIATFADPKKGYDLLIKILSTFVDKFNPNDKFITVGFNGEFDVKFLRQFFKNFNDNYYGSWFDSKAPVDVHKLFTGLRASHMFPELEALPNLKLSTLAQHYNIAIDAHDAMSDIEATFALYKVFLQQLSRCTPEALGKFDSKLATT